MAEHPADRFKGDPMRECDFRCVCMPSCMEDQRTVNVADSGNLFQVEVQRNCNTSAAACHRELKIAIFLSESATVNQKRNLKFYLGFLPGTLIHHIPSSARHRLSFVSRRISPYGMPVKQEKEHVTDMIEGLPEAGWS